MTLASTDLEVLRRAHQELDQRPARSLKQLASRVGVTPADLRNADEQSDNTLLSRLPHTEQTEHAKNYNQSLQDGLTLQEIGRRANLTRERIRQVLDAHGYDSTAGQKARRNTRETEQTNAVSAVRAALIASPGQTRAELAAITNTKPEAVTAALSDPSLRRLLSAAKPSGTGMDDQAALESLKTVAQANGGLTAGLSTKSYDALRDHNSSLSAVRILQRFGTWKAACTQAGIASGQTNRPNYTRRWEPARLLNLLADYLSIETCAGTYADFDTWLRTQSNAPSAQTVRNTIGPQWATAKAQGFAELARRKVC